MTKNFRTLLFAMMGLAILSCSKSNELEPNVNQVKTEGEAVHFQLNASISSIAMESALSTKLPTDTEDELRAGLHFNGAKTLTTTELSFSDFGLRMNGATAGDKINARWGVVRKQIDKYFAINCKDAKEQYNGDARTLTENTIVYSRGAKANTIGDDQVTMYCSSKQVGKLKNVEEAWMCLDGVEGKNSTQEDLTKQYFIAEQGGRQINTDPNHRLEPVALGQMQEGRHIPIMSKVEGIANFQSPVDETKKVKLRPRGSLISLSLKNNIGTTMKITGIVVKRDGPFDYSGYFDWAKTDAQGQASFVPKYLASQTGSALVFPVYAKGSNTVGYDLANGSDPVCFFIWGFQRKNKAGEPFQLQVRYKIEGKGDAFTTRVFKVFPPEVQVGHNAGKKLFEDGYAYNTSIDIVSMNMKGGSRGTDWSDGGFKPAEGVVVMEVNPLSYVSKGYALNKDGSKFVADDYTNDGKTNYDEYTNEDVGLFTWAEAMRQFGFDISNEDKENRTFTEQEIFNFRQGGQKEIDHIRYHLPNRAEWQSIVPYSISPEVATQNHPNILEGITADNWHNKGEEYKKYTYIYGDKIGGVQLIHYWKDKILDEVRTNRSSLLSNRTVQIGSVRMTGDQYTSKFITKQEGDVLVTYAKRFIGTPFESAWRYSYDDVAGNNMLYIQCLSLRMNSNIDLRTIIARKDFFDNSTDVVKRYFPTYGHRDLGSTSVDYSTYGGYYWSSLPYASGGGFRLHLYSNDATLGSSNRHSGFALRPFYSN